MSSSLNGLDPTVVPRFIALEAGIQAKGIKAMRTDAHRTTDEQIARWAQGRGTLPLVNLLRQKAGMGPTKDAFTTTDCDGINTPSNHQSGRAADYVVCDEKGDPSWDYHKWSKEYKAIAEVSRALGFRCGADWMKKPDGSPSPYAADGLGWDPPHHEVP